MPQGQSICTTSILRDPCRTATHARARLHSHVRRHGRALAVTLTNDNSPPCEAVLQTPFRTERRGRPSLREAIRATSAAISPHVTMFQQPPGRGQRAQTMIKTSLAGEYINLKRALPEGRSRHTFCCHPKRLRFSLMNTPKTAIRSRSAELSRPPANLHVARRGWCIVMLNMTRTDLTYLRRITG